MGPNVTRYKAIKHLVIIAINCLRCPKWVKNQSHKSQRGAQSEESQSQVTPHARAQAETADRPRDLNDSLVLLFFIYNWCQISCVLCDFSVVLLFRLLIELNFSLINWISLLSMPSLVCFVSSVVLSNGNWINRMAFSSVPPEAEYADYHQAMAQHAASLANSHQLQGIGVGQLGQINMQQLMSSGLNLTVSSANQLSLSGVHVRHFVWHKARLGIRIRLRPVPDCQTCDTEQTRRPLYRLLDKICRQTNQTVIAFPLFLYYYLHWV